METPPIDETPIRRKLIGDALFSLADSIDKHAAKEVLSFHQIIDSLSSDDPNTPNLQRDRAHMWFSTRGGFGDQAGPYGQSLLYMTATELGLNKDKFKEYFRNDGDRDGYNIGSYSSRVREKTNQLRSLAAQLVSSV